MYHNQMIVQLNHFPPHIMVDAVLRALDVSVSTYRREQPMVSHCSAAEL